MHQNGTRKSRARPVSLRDISQIGTQPVTAISYAMKMPNSRGLTLIPRLDVVIEPLRRLGKRRDAMGFASPDAEHRYKQEDE